MGESYRKDYKNDTAGYEVLSKHNPNTRAKKKKVHVHEYNDWIFVMNLAEHRYYGVDKQWHTTKNAKKYTRACISCGHKQNGIGIAQHPIHPSR